MNKYKDLTEQVMSKVQEIFDCAKYSEKIEIQIQMEIGSSPCISYKIYDFHIVANEEGGITKK